MEDVLEVYQRAYDPARPVICLDEKSKELHTTPHGTLPLKTGKPRREDYEYARNGTRNLFLWVEPLSGRRQVCVTERRTALDFAQQLKSLVAAYPQAAQVVLVTDNLNTHTPACLYDAFAPEEARRIGEAATLVQEVAVWQERRNRIQTPIRWQFTTGDARIKLRRLYPILANTA